MATLGLTAPRGPTSAPVGEDAKDADCGRRTTGAACPARRGTAARPRRPGSSATGQSSRGGRALRTRPSPRGRRRSCSTPLAKTLQEQRNPAVRTQSPGAVCGQARRHMGYPAPVGRRTLRRVVGAAQHCRMATARAAGDETADRAQLHPRIVRGQAGVVYTLPVLRLRDHRDCAGYGPDSAWRCGARGRREPLGGRTLTRTRRRSTLFSTGAEEREAQ